MWLLQEEHLQQKRQEAEQRKWLLKKPVIHQPEQIPPSVVYEASDAFISETLRHSDAQRHTRDNISPDALYELRMTSLRRQLLEYELAEQRQAEQERLKQARIDFVKAKQVQGLAEVVAGCVVTVYDVEAEETVSYYMASAEQKYQNKQRVFVEHHDVPPGGADECLSADCDLYKSLLGSFVDDEVQAQVPDGILTFRILSVKSCNVAEGGLRVEMSVRNNTDSETQAHERIGSETWTFVARDGGQFGSFSWHDDYSDESDAEVQDNDWVDEYE